MEDSIKNIITALLADDDSALKELFRAQVEDAVNQFLQNEMTAVLGYEPYARTGDWGCLRMPCLSPTPAVPQRLKKRSS